MPISSSRGSYLDCYEIFDRAMDTKSGVKVPCKDHDAAMFLRMRLHQARAINRKDNKQVYDPDHPMFNASPYDIFTVQLANEDGKFFVLLKRAAVPEGIISLDDEEPAVAEAAQESRRV